MGAGGAHHRLLSSTTPPNASIFVPSCLPTLPSYLYSCLPLFFSSNHQATVVDVNSSYSFYMECGGFTMRVKEPCPAVSWFGEFLNNNFKLVISYSFNHLK